MAAQEECPVCCESFNRSTHKPLNCPYCNVEMCRTCTGQAIMYDIGDPGCQSCKKVWTDDVLYSYFTKKFVNTEIAEKLKKKYMELEMSLLPESQYFASKLKKVDQMEKEWKMFDKTKIDAIKMSLYQSGVKINRFTQEKIILNGVDDESLEKIFKIDKCLNDKDRLKACVMFWDAVVYQNDYYAKRRYFYVAYWYGKPGNLEDIQPYIKQLDDYNLDLCKYTVTVKSRRKYAYNDARRYLERGEDVDKDDSHECKKENVDSVKMKYKNSKPCPNPNCGVPIFKSSGCSQMWCTACHTIFDWNTQSIVETKNIHNPHYHEYNRAKNVAANREAVQEEPDEGECGRPSHAAMLIISGGLGLRNEYKTKYGRASIISPRHHKIDFLPEFRRILGEILDGSRLRFYPDGRYTENTLIRSRIRVIQGLMTKERLGELALETVRYNTFNMKARELHYMLCTTGIDILRKLATGKDVKLHYIELYNLCCMFNVEGRKLYNTYKIRFHYLSWLHYHLHFDDRATITASKKGNPDDYVLFEYDPHLKEYITELKKELEDELKKELEDELKKELDEETSTVST